MIPLFFRQKSATIRPVQCRKSLCTRALGVATVIGLLLASTAEAVTRLQANRYTEVDFKGRSFIPHLHRPSEEFIFTVTDNSVATLRVTELGCPGNVFIVDISDVTIGGTDFRFKTSSVPFQIFCRRPLHIDQASDAFTSPSYSKGSVELTAGTYIVQITPHSKFATSAAIGFFPSAVSTTGVSTAVSTVIESLTTNLGTTATTVVETTISESTVAPETIISSISEPTTTFSEPAPTTSETSDTATVESDTSTAVASETLTVVIPSTSGDITETTTSEGPTPTDISTSLTAEPSSATEPGTAITSDITTFSEPEPTISETSDTATVESDTSTAVTSKTSAVVSPSTSGEITETTTSEGPTPTDISISPTAGPSSATEPGTAITSDITTFSEPEPTTSETSDTATVESDTSTAVASETSAVVSPSTSGEITETTTSEIPTPTDITASPTVGSGSTTETGSPTTTVTTDEATSTHSVPTPLATCNGESRYLSLVTSPAYLFNDAEEACGVNYRMAKVSTFKEIKDAGNVLKACGVQSAWIKVESANMLEPPKCYAISLDKLYEPADCEQQVMQVLCSTP